MPPLPTIANVWRVTLDWEKTGNVAPRNVFHVRCAGGTDDDIFSAIDAAMEHVVSGNKTWVNCFKGAGTLVTLLRASLLKLDGTSASTDHSFTSSIHGSGGGDLLPSSAIVLSLKTATRGARGRGRMFIGPIGEAVSDGGFIAATYGPTMLGGWQTFQAQLALATIPVELVIASYAHADAHPVTSMRVDTVLGVQRRRNDQLR